MKKNILIFITFIGIIGFITIPTNSIFPFKTDNFDVDILGNIYVVHEAELLKYDDKLKQQATYINLSLGEIDMIDASDAMNLLVFYKDFAKLVFLDNTLSVKKSAIDLGELGFPNASLACLSYNNGFWIFDPVNQELVRITQFLEVGERSGNLNQIINTELEPDQLFESGSKVYLKDYDEGIFVFDRYGGYLKRLPFFNLDDLQIGNTSALIMLRNDTTFTYNTQTLVLDTFINEFKSIQKARITNRNIYYLMKNGIVIKKKHANSNF